MKSIFSAFIPFVAAALLFLGFRSQPGMFTSTTPLFTVAIVAQGLSHYKDTDSCSPDSGCAMARGVMEAAKSEAISPYYCAVNNAQPANGKLCYLTFMFRDDKRDASLAREIALQLAATPNVLAVIGHSSSDTTRVAADIYHGAQLPLVVPIASTPYLKDPLNKSSLTPRIPDYLPDPDDRLNNIFSIIPDDTIGQVPALRYLLSTVGALDDVTVISDATDNQSYVTGLTASLHSLMPTLRVLPPLTERDPESKLATIRHMHLTKTIVFVGTENNATWFLANLAQLSSISRPTVILTDGGRDISPQSLSDCLCNVLLMFPTKPLDIDQLTNHPHSANLALLGHAYINDSSNPSYEEYGFDSVLFLAKALHRICPDPRARNSCTISRSSLLNAMQRIEFLEGARNKYLFNVGDNVNPEYSVYGHTLSPLGQHTHTCADLTLASGSIGTGSAASDSTSPSTGQPSSAQPPTPSDRPSLSFICSIRFEDMHAVD